MLSCRKKIEPLSDQRARRAARMTGDCRCKRYDRSMELLALKHANLLFALAERAAPGGAGPVALASSGVAAYAIASAVATSRRQAAAKLKAAALSKQAAQRVETFAAAKADAQRVESQRRARLLFLRDQLLTTAALLGDDALTPDRGDVASRRAATALLDELLSLALPAETHSSSALDGTWRLALAENGTVVTRALAPPPLPLSVSNIQQTLRTTSADGVLSLENTAEVRAGALGAWRLAARGVFEEDKSAGGEASVTLAEFGVSPLSLLGLAVDGSPELNLPLPPPIRQTASFPTRYVDARVRVSEGGSSGNRFVFVRGGARD
jgi:hypothetical protein